MKAAIVSVVPILACAFCLAACGGGEGSTTAHESAPTQSRPAAESVHSKPTPGFHQSGKLDIPAFGVEAGAGELRKAQAVLESYLQARAKGDWATAGAYLLASSKRQLQEAAAALNPAAGNSCASALEQSFKRYSQANPGSRANLPAGGIAGLRVQPHAGAGFALYHGVDGHDYWVAVRVERGGWKVISPSPSDLSASR